MLEAILTLKISGDYQTHDLERARILIDSLDRFWIGREKLRLTIIARDEDVGQISAELSATRIDIIVIKETTLLPCLLSMPSVKGWFKQQALKLAAHRLLTAPFCLVLDSDLICAQPFSGETFVVDGKALTDWTSRLARPAWWQGSARTLQLPADLDSPGISITPEILSKTICQRLEERIVSLYKQDCWTYLLQNLGWTEYTLYTLFAIDADMIDTFHHSAHWMRVNKKSLRAKPAKLDCWMPADFENWTPEMAFQPGQTGFFMVCQSNMLVDPARVRQKLVGLLY